MKYWGKKNCVQNAFEEDGVLHGKKVYLFGCTERKYISNFSHSRSEINLNSLESNSPNLVFDLWCYMTSYPFAAQLVSYKGESKVVCIPVVVAVSCHTVLYLHENKIYVLASLTKLIILYKLLHGTNLCDLTNMHSYVPSCCDLCVGPGSWVG